MENRYYIELLERYHKHQLSGQELIEIFDWINSPEGEVEYDQYLSEQIGLMKDENEECPKDIAERVLKRAKEKVKIGKAKPHTFSLQKMKMYAAILLIAMLTGSVAYLLVADKNNSDKEPVVFVVSKGNKGTLILPDKSKVWLNSESKITYSGDKRKITLEGEAYLQVTKDKKRLFLVSTPYGDIRVYGTAFNVIAYPGDSTLSVSLVEGSVGIQVPGHDNIIYIAPGQIARFDVQNKHLELDDKDLTDVALWRNDKMILTDAGIHTLCDKMEAWYSLKIILINQPYKNHQYNMTIRNETIDEILALINKVTPIRYSIKGKEVSIEYIR
ncbi:MAG: FecR family protein [Tannerellaceae bacterium]|jgi:ferric-dicitrate binding protein FerR (iron transport regulator)|nr:FecR family protein [Tannerellaceae bacterium]